MTLKSRLSLVLNHSFRYLAILTAACLLLGGCINNRVHMRKPPTAVRGLLDLRDWDFSENGPINLDGEWELYWEQFLSPADFTAGGGGARPPRLTGIVRVPGSWQDYRLPQHKRTGDGYATYRLRLLLPDTPQRMGLYIPQLYTAYQLWANGRRIASAGKTGRSRETMTPQYIQRVVSCKPRHGRLELLIRVSNFHHRRGGIWRSAQLGIYGQIKRDSSLQKAFVLLVLGSFLLMAVYNLSLYFCLKRGPAPLLLSLFFWIASLRLTLVGPVLYSQFFPNFSWELAMKLEYFTFYFCGPVFYLMLRNLYPTKISVLFVRTNCWMALFFSVFTGLTPARTYTCLAPVFQLILLGGVIYMGVVLGLVSVKRREYLMLSVFTIIFLSLFNDILFYNNLLRAEFPMIPIIEGFIDFPFGLRRIPAGFISMVCFIFVFNLLTLKMTQYYFAQPGLKAEPAAALVEELSPREAEVVRYLILGYSNKEIAAQLEITEGTVKNHLHNIYQKTGAKNRTGLSHLLKK